MTTIQLILFILLVQVIHFAGTWKLYEKAGRKWWEAAIPVYNAIVLMKIIKRPTWWVILLFIPIIHLLMFPVIWIETIRSFGKKSRVDSILVLLTLGLYIYYINYVTDVKYANDRSLEPQSALGDWISSIAFAIIAATLVHTYFMRPYVIPTSSLEKSLLVGDFLFVSKFHYGARVPITPIALPMVHDTIPVLKTGSYLKKPQLPYYRLPGLQKIKRNEIVVFNWPADTLATMWGDNSGKYTYKPIDKKTNYVKRCVAIAGDTLQIINGDIYINREKSIMPDRAKPQHHYTIYSSKGISTKLIQKYGSTEYDREFYIDFKNDTQYKIILNFVNKNPQRIKDNKFKITTGSNGIPDEILKKYRIKITEIKSYSRIANFTKDEAQEIQKNPIIDSVIKKNIIAGTYNKSVFPHNKEYKWSNDNFGPLYIPEKGKTIELNEKTIPLYKHLIEEYEHLNNVTFNNNDVYIDGEKVTDYTFSQDYYWMMGDNRHNSLDARSYGFTPMDHVVGKPVFIWMSFKNGMPWSGGTPRWERFFTTVHGSGKPVSYLYYFLGLLAIWIVYSNFIKKKKKA